MSEVSSKQFYKHGKERQAGIKERLQHRKAHLTMEVIEVHVPTADRKYKAFEHAVAKETQQGKLCGQDTSRARGSQACWCRLVHQGIVHVGPAREVSRPEHIPEMNGL